MNSERIREIQQSTAYPESTSVQQALMQVWNELKQENTRCQCDKSIIAITNGTVDLCIKALEDAFMNALDRRIAIKALEQLKAQPTIKDK